MENASDREKRPFVRKKFALALVTAFVCIAALLTALAFPGFHHALQRGRQQRAMKEMGLLGKQLEEYLRSNKDFPPSTKSMGQTSDLMPVSLTWAQLGVALPPTISPIDPWGHPYLFAKDAKGATFLLVCTGKAGKVEAIDELLTEGGTHCFENDIVWQADRFTRFPLQEQHSCK